MVFKHMAKRSLCASEAGIRKAKQQFAARNWTQEFLAAEVGIKTRQPIWRFFAGQSIERFTFFEICTTLDLDWREIASNPPAESRLDVEIEDVTPTTPKTDPQLATLNLDDLAKIVRSQWREKVEHQCGIVQTLDISRSVSIDRIYVDVYVHEQMASQQWLDISILDDLPPTNIDDSSFNLIAETKIPALQAVEKYGNVRLLGKPGCGKSTFLKYLAIQCNREKFAIGHVPIFIVLRDFAESYRDNPQFNFLEYIHQEFFTAGLFDPTLIMNLLQGGRILFLIDGIDELGREEENIAFKEMRRFFEKYYKNKFVVSCRTSVQKLALKGFTDLQVAPFSETQITSFTRKWFTEFGKPDGTDALRKASQFVENLKSTENQRIRRLVTTPLFLHLACTLFHRPDKFATKKVEFYKQALELLLGNWDEVRGIQRTQVYTGFGLVKRLNYACELAFETFEKGQCFFEEEVLEKFTVKYITNQVEVGTDPEEIYQSTEAVLRAIKAQYHGLLVQRARGIFSFSYLAFQEYLIARLISVSCNIQSSEECLYTIMSHLSDRRWREVFLITANMLRCADDLVLIMSQKIEAMLSQDSCLQDFLDWLNREVQNDLPHSFAEWVEMLQQAIATHQDSAKWKFSLKQKQALQDYGYANQLLLDCLNSNCEVSASIREAIENNIYSGFCGKSFYSIKLSKHENLLLV
jgi:predicted NACHT family NTPase